MQNTEIDKQFESDHNDAKDCEPGINAILIDATKKSKHTDYQHQKPAIAPGLEELSMKNPNQNDTSKQCHNCNDVDMAESSKLDNVRLTDQSHESKKKGLITTCSGREKETDADTSMLVEVSELNTLSGADLQNAHNQHADNKN